MKKVIFALSCLLALNSYAQVFTALGYNAAKADISKNELNYKNAQSHQLDYQIKSYKLNDSDWPLALGFRAGIIGHGDVDSKTNSLSAYYSTKYATSMYYELSAGYSMQLELPYDILDTGLNFMLGYYHERYKDKEKFTALTPNAKLPANKEISLNTNAIKYGISSMSTILNHFLLGINVNLKTYLDDNRTKIAGLNSDSKTKLEADVFVGFKPWFGKSGFYVGVKAGKINTLVHDGGFFGLVIGGSY